MKRKVAVFLCVIAIIFCLTGCSLFEKKATVSMGITSMDSPDGNYTLSVFYYVDSVKGTGNGKGYFTLMKPGLITGFDSVDYTIANDGKQPDESNFSAEWLENSVSITVKGEKQQDTIYTINLK